MANERILATGKIVDNEIHWSIAPLTSEDSADDEMYGSEDFNDDDEQTAEYESWLEDESWIRHGC